MPDPASRIRVAVVGLGSIGGIVAACLAEAGRHDIVACTRRPLERLTLEHGERSVELPLHAATEPAAAPAPADWVLLCTKTHQTAAAAPWLRRLCGQGTRVAVLQNGVDQAARVAPLAGSAAVLPVIVYFNGERLAPDRVRLSQVAGSDLCAPDDADGRAFSALFVGTPLRVSTLADFTTPLWRKLLLNVAANPVSALTRRRQAVFRDPEVQALALALLHEAVAVARAEGAALADDEAERTLAILLGYPPESGTSMYFDVLAGRPTEADALTGAVVAAGARHGIATPLNRALLTLLRALGERPEGA